MSVIKKTLSTDMLPPSLSERQRLINSIHIGTTMVGRCDGSLVTVRREKRQVIETGDDPFCLVRNTGDRIFRVVHRGHEFALRPGAMVLVKLEKPFFAADGANQKRFTNLRLPGGTLRAMVADARKSGRVPLPASPNARSMSCSLRPAPAS